MSRAGQLVVAVALTFSGLCTGAAIAFRFMSDQIEKAVTLP